ncbi:MAG: glycosyltransferase [Magnetococcales bacterium]|nr:glycosyltransferase [Magnetococcales bacterium]
MATETARTVLMVAFHFPPARGLSGIQRTLKAVRYLPDYQWQPVVLSAHPRAYGCTGTEQMGEIPASVSVSRAFALDSARHLSFKGRYLRLTALPDRWASWWLGAVPTGLALIRRHRPKVIWSSYPIATSHLIALTLHRLTGIPWVADCRDAMCIDTFPDDPLTRKAFVRLERAMVHRCARLTVTTPGMLNLYRERYPELPRDRFSLLYNGYDEEDFENLPTASPRAPRSPLVLLHSGQLYPGLNDRDPCTFIEVLHRLHVRGVIGPASLEVIFRATGEGGYVQDLIRRYEVSSFVRVEPPLPYRQALQEMMQVDALLLLQGSHFGHLIPAKLFEYLRVGKPLLPFVPPQSDSAALLRQMDFETPTDMHDAPGMENALLTFLEQVKNGTARHGEASTWQRFSRRQQVAELAALFNAVTNGP